MPGSKPVVISTFDGLQTRHDIGKVPPGKLTEAHNIRFREESIISKPGLSLALTVPGVSTSSSNVTMMNAFGSIEVVDDPIQNFTDAGPYTFLRTLFRLDRGYYPDNVTFAIEADYQNMSGADYSVKIFNGLNQLVNTLVFPSTGLNDPTRYSGFPLWTPVGSLFYLQLPLAASDNSHKMFIQSLRLRTTDEGAKGTVDIPMTAFDVGTSLDQGASYRGIFSTQSATLQDPGQAASYWKYNASEWATLANINFSAVLGTFSVFGGAVAELDLFDVTANASVTGSALTLAGAANTTPTLVHVDLAPSVLTDGHIYTIKLKSQTGSANDQAILHKSRITLQLSPWAKSLFMVRVGKNSSNINGGARALGLDPTTLTGWDGTVKADLIGSAHADSKNMYLFDGVLNETGSTGANIVGTTAPQINGTKTITRIADFRANYVAGHRILSNADNGADPTQSLLIFPIVKT